MMKKTFYPTSEFEINSTIDNIPKAIEFVETEVRKAGLPEEEVANCSIAVSEAITNAVIHGNKLDEKKKVVVRVKRGKNAISMSVEDNGRGFSLSEVKNPLKPENKKKEHGRGVFIMNTLSDRVKYAFKEHGTEVIIIKKIRNS